MQGHILYLSDGGVSCLGQQKSLAKVCEGLAEMNAETHQQRGFGGQIK